MFPEYIRDIKKEIQNEINFLIMLENFMKKELGNDKFVHGERKKLLDEILKKGGIKKNKLILVDYIEILIRSLKNIEKRIEL